jgi:hypothetical protein
LAGQIHQAVAVASSLVPVDVYEWTHVFECLLRAGRLEAVDMHSFLYRPPNAAGHRWADLARRRMRLDYLRVTGPHDAELNTGYPEVIEAYDRGGLPYERSLTRLGQARWLLSRDDPAGAEQAVTTVQAIARRHGMRVVEADAACILATAAVRQGDMLRAAEAQALASALRRECGYCGPARP